MENALSKKKKTHSDSIIIYLLIFYLINNILSSQVVQTQDCSWLWSQVLVSQPTYQGNSNHTRQLPPLSLGYKGEN